MTDSTEPTASSPLLELNERQRYVLGWIFANEIVQTHFQSAAVDAIPVLDPSEHKWDRFLLTRRISCIQHIDDDHNASGTILLRGDNAPYVMYHGEQLPLQPVFRRSRESAIKMALAGWTELGLAQGDHSSCWHTRAAVQYPLLFQAVTDLIVNHSEVCAAREVFVDDQHIDGTYHPLYLHGVVTQPEVVYDWFSVEADDRLVYFRINGDQAFYHTQGGSWRAVGPVLRQGTLKEAKHNIQSWLQLD